ncbi:MAG: polysaccharide biosynthesis protein [Pedobacter sp.]
MIRSVQRLQNNPKYAKLYEWGKLISLTGSAQIFIQAIGMITGILIIRMLTTQEYAYYTIANTMLGTMTILADGGVSIGVMNQGGKVWNDKRELGTVLSTGMALRKMFGVYSLLISIPILSYLLWHQGAGPWTIVLIVLTLIPAFFAAMSDSLLEIFPKLNQDIKSLQVNQITVSIVRLVLSCVSVFFLPFTFIAILASGIPRLYGNYKLKAIAHKFAESGHAPDEQRKKEMLKIVRATLPGAIYYCLSGQITIWLITLFGTASSIAQVGALGRFSMLLSIFSVMFSTLITPRFARFPNNIGLLASRFLQFLILILVISLIITGLTYLFPSQILWVLGKEYSGLYDALILSIIGGCIGLGCGAIYSLTSSRGWVVNPVILIVYNVLVIIIGLLILDVSTIEGILLLNIFIGCSQIVMLIILFVYKLFKMKNGA